MNAKMPIWLAVVLGVALYYWTKQNTIENVVKYQRELQGYK